VTRLRAEVTDRHGTTPDLMWCEVKDSLGLVAVIVDRGVLAKLTCRERAALDSLADRLVTGLASLLGGNEKWAREVAVAELIRLVADEDAYERVCERRGVLPL
jgi:hypothetical protein